MYVTKNGWTKAKMIEAINTKMQDHPAVFDGGGCAYLASDGNRCAVGAFIPDEGFEEALAFKGGVYSLTDKFRDLKSKLPLELTALSILQSIHDEAAEKDQSDRRPEIIAWIERNVQDPEQEAVA